MASTESHLTDSSSRSSTGSREGDHRSSEEIRRSIERRRDDLDVTADELQHKLAPRELAEQLWHDVRSRVGGGAGDVVEVVRRHPVPLGLIGAGIAWWIYESSSGRSAVGNGGHHEGYDELAYSSSDYAAESRDARESSWRERSMQAAQRSTERLRTGATSARQGFNDAVDHNPLALGAACLSLGILAGIAMPSSRWERQTLGDASSKVSRRAKHMAKEAAVNAAEQGARAAQTAAERLREEAEKSASQYRGTREGELGSGSSSQGNPSGDEPDPWNPNRPPRV